MPLPITKFIFSLSLVWNTSCSISVVLARFIKFSLIKSLVSFIEIYSSALIEESISMLACKSPLILIILLIDLIALVISSSVTRLTNDFWDTAASPVHSYSIDLSSLPKISVSKCIRECMPYLVYAETILSTTFWNSSITLFVCKWSFKT